MSKDVFSKRKQDILSKIDKSFKQSWDKKIIGLCNKINSLKNYYTTSSCSGRIVLMIDQDKKAEGLFIKVYHDLIDFKNLKNDLIEISKKNKKPIKFKQESCILHVACRTLEDASDILRKARLIGWKRSGIISFGKRIMVELISTERLEFPIIDRGRILVDSDFLRLIVQKSNKKLKNGWKKIWKLNNLLG